MKRVGFIQGSRIKHDEDWFPSGQTRVYEEDDFLGDILKDKWDVVVAAGCTVAIVAGLNGLVALTTVAGDNFYSTMVGELNYNATLYAGIEARLALDDITNCQIEMGLNDAKLEAQGRMVDDVDLTGGLPTPVCTNGAAIVFDPTDSVIQHLCGVGVIGGVGSVNDLGIALVNGVYQILKVQLDVLGNAYYYLDNALIATELLAVTPLTPLTPWLTISNKAGAIARVLTIDYVKSWKRRV